MSLFQALLCGLFYYLNAGPWIVGVGYYTFGKPLVLGFFVGLVLGNPVMGTVIGAMIQLIYLGLMSTGGSYPADAALAAIIGTAAAITAGLSAAEAVAVAVPIGLLGTIFFQLRMIIGVFWSHLADTYAEKGETNKVWMANVLFPQLCIAAIYVIPCTLACYFGVSYIEAGVKAISGTRALAIIGAIGGMLPALGIAMNMKVIFKGDAKLFFFFGFILAVYFKLDLIAIGFLAVLSAMIFVKLQKGGGAETAGQDGLAAIADSATPAAGADIRRVSKKSLLKCFLNWLFMAHGTYNYERFQGTGFLHAMSPIIDDLYDKSDIEGRREAMKRHTAFFNTEVRMGSSIVGLCASMEERIASGDTGLTGESMGSIKYGLMGPIAGIGDTIIQAILVPLLLSMALGLAQTGNVAGPILYLILFIGIVVVLGYECFMLGYRKGDQALLGFIESGVINRVITGAGIMGCTLMGALVAKFVSLSTIINFKVATGTFNLQENVFNAIMPKMLPLLLTLAVFWLLKRKKGGSSLLVMLYIIVAGALLGILGII